MFCKYLAYAILMFSSAIGFSQYAELSFIDKPIVKWGKVNEGVELTHYFVFQNTGEQPLVIEEIKVACSCTKVTFPKQPIAPLEQDTIFVSFDTNNKFYHQDRVVEIFSNSRRKDKIKLKAYVIPREEE